MNSGTICKRTRISTASCGPQCLRHGCLASLPFALSFFSCMRSFALRAFAPGQQSPPGRHGHGHVLAKTKMQMLAMERTIVMQAGTTDKTRICHTVTVVAFVPDDESSISPFLLPVESAMPIHIRIAARMSWTIESISSEFFARTARKRVVRGGGTGGGTR